MDGVLVTRTAALGGQEAIALLKEREAVSMPYKMNSDLFFSKD